MSQKNTFNVLSIDGGGIRGIIPAMILAKIEEETGKNISCLFDLIVGTSTGGILALGLTQKGTPEKPQLSAKELVKIYKDHGSTIFDPSWLEEVLSEIDEDLEPLRDSESTTRVWVVKSWEVISGYGRKALSVLKRLGNEKYPRDGLEKVFNACVDENLCLEDVTTKTMVTCYDMQNPETVFLKSWNEAHKPIKIKDAAFATSAAPTYFEPLPLRFAEKERTLIDGGIFINSPVVSAYAEAQRLISERDEYKCYAKDDIFVVSLGTGEFAAGTGYSEAKDWGAARWLLELVNYIAHSGPAAVDYQMERLLPADNYVRLQIALDKKHAEMDNASDDNIRYLKSQARQLIDSCEFEKLYCRLKEQADKVCE